MVLGVAVWSIFPTLHPFCQDGTVAILLMGSPPLALVLRTPARTTPSSAETPQAGEEGLLYSRLCIYLRTSYPSTEASHIKNAPSESCPDF